MTGQKPRIPSRAEPRFFYGYVIAVVALLVMVITWGTNYSFGVFFTPLLVDFGWTRAMTSAAFSLAILFEGLGGMVMGRLTDKLGSRLVITACGLLLGIGYLLMSQVSHVWQLYLYYGVIVGIGLSASYVSLLSTVARWFVRRRGMMTGIVVAGVGMGTLIMAPIANQLILSHGWRTSYIIVGIVALVGIVIAAQFLRRAPNQVGQVYYGAKEDKEDKTNSQPSPTSLEVAIHNRQLWLLCSILFFWGFGQFVILVHIVSHAIEIGISATSAANILAAMGGATVVAKIVLGIAADRIGSKLTFIIGLAMMSAALLWLLVARELWALYLFAVVFAFGYACGSVLMPTILAEIFGLSSLGVILGIANFAACIGCATGPVVAGWLFDISGEYMLAFFVTTAFSIIALTLTILLRPTGRN